MSIVLDLVTVGDCMVIGSSSQRMDRSVDRVYGRAMIIVTLHFRCCFRAVNEVVSIAFHFVQDLKADRHELKSW